MIDLIVFAATIVASAFGYVSARRFVRERLRYVDAVQGLRGPVVAGLVAWALAMPLVWLLPLVGPGTAILFGAGIGLGVRAGAKDVRVANRIAAG